nr:unnamed protein product [Digitaria exilis]
MATPRLLVVDDSCVDRLVVSRVLQSCNIKVFNCCRYFAVTVVEGPKEALKFLAMMEVKNSPKISHLPVVIMCTDDVPARIKRALMEGQKASLSKL